MKQHLFITTPLAILLSTSVYANSQQQFDHDRSGFYIAVGSYDHTIEVEDLDLSPSQAFGLKVGYDYQISEPFAIGTEIEYTFPAEYKLISNVGSVKYDYSSLSLSMKPKYYLADSGLYIGGIIGLTQHIIDGATTLNGMTIEGTDTESDISFGAEIGYETESGVLVTATYRKADADIDTVPTDISNISVSLGYKF